LDMWSLQDPDSGRGRKYKRVVINEAAMARYLEYAWNNVIRPALADYEGDAFFPSTPKGLNYYHTLWSLAESEPGWARFRYPTQSNPYIKPSEIEAMRGGLPERVYQQEILAEFLADGAYFQNVDAAASVVDRDTPDHHAGHSLFMGADWAKSEDFSAFVVGCRNCNRVVDWWRSNRLDFTYQRERLVNMAQRWKVSGVLPERNSVGEPNIEILIQAGLHILRGPDDKAGFNTMPNTKPTLIEKFALALEHDGFLVPKEAADELRSYEVEMSTSGHPKFSAPEGLHDDWVIALALTWWAMTNASWYFSWTDD
jgi:hypothetical protein